MTRLLAWLGVLLGFAVARGLDAAWVMFWYVGDRALTFPLQAGVDALGLAAAGSGAGLLAQWLAGRAAWGIGLCLGGLLLAATAVDLLVGIADQPWWHEPITALVMVPFAAFAGGARLRGSRRP